MSRSTLPRLVLAAALCGLTAGAALAARPADKSVAFRAAHSGGGLVKGRLYALRCGAPSRRRVAQCRVLERGREVARVALEVPPQVDWQRLRFGSVRTGVASGSSAATGGLLAAHVRVERGAGAVDLLVPPPKPIHDQGKEPPVGPPPFASQVGGKTATLPMEHGACGAGCMTHVAAVGAWSLKVPFEIGVDCKGGATANYLAYALQGKPQVVVLNGPTALPSYSKDLVLQPFSLAEAATACAASLGGPWVPPASHHNASSSAAANLAETIDVWSRCSGDLVKNHSQLPVSATIDCVDQDFP